MVEIAIRWDKAYNNWAYDHTRALWQLPVRKTPAAPKTVRDMVFRQLLVSITSPTSLHFLTISGSFRDVIAYIAYTSFVNPLFLVYLALPFFMLLGFRTLSWTRVFRIYISALIATCPIILLLYPLLGQCQFFLFLFSFSHAQLPSCVAP